MSARVYQMTPFALFLVLLFIFHTSEFLLAAVFNPQTLSWNSWLLNRYYAMAMLLACVEYAIELHHFPWLKLWWVTAYGIWLAAVGEAVRKAGVLTARRNFTHKIQFQQREDHVLVTHGIYRWVRHPGYLGWVIWAIATQVVLCNPVCGLGFAVVAWCFMRQRIAVEDRLLYNFFGEEWLQWQRAVPSGLPWIP